MAGALLAPLCPGSVLRELVPHGRGAAELDLTSSNVPGGSDGRLSVAHGNRLAKTGGELLRVLHHAPLPVPDAEEHRHDAGRGRGGRDRRGRDGVLRAQGASVVEKEAAPALHGRLEARVLAPLRRGDANVLVTLAHGDLEVEVAVLVPQPHAGPEAWHAAGRGVLPLPEASDILGRPVAHSLVEDDGRLIRTYSDGAFHLGALDVEPALRTRAELADLDQLHHGTAGHPLHSHAAGHDEHRRGQAAVRPHGGERHEHLLLLGVLAHLRALRRENERGAARRGSHEQSEPDRARGGVLDHDSVARAEDPRDGQLRGL
mmetsp:Transcript_143318/g.445498  ORF Transcript_143318/g.445498 Transcript_143318/m.445498 type:complete len:317 (+) Transcript_143318:135-1085(+)